MSNIEQGMMKDEGREGMSNVEQGMMKDEGEC
jgi:hypothetical protein